MSLVTLLYVLTTFILPGPHHFFSGLLRWRPACPFGAASFSLAPPLGCCQDELPEAQLSPHHSATRNKALTLTLQSDPLFSPSSPFTPTGSVLKVFLTAFSFPRCVHSHYFPHRKFSPIFTFEYYTVFKYSNATLSISLDPSLVPSKFIFRCV